MFKLLNLVQGSPEWLNYRKSGLGASEAPAMLDLPGAYGTRAELIQEKLGLSQKAITDFQKQIFQEGHEIEAVVRNEMNAREWNFVPLVMEEEPFTGCFTSLDGCDMERRVLLEVKSTTSEKILEQAVNGWVPGIYNTQIQFQLMVSGFDQCELVVVNKNDGVRHLLHVYRNEEQIKTLRAESKRFLADLESARANLPAINEDADAVRLEAVVKAIKHHESEVKKLDDEKKFLASKLLEKYKATTIQNERIKIEYAERAGSVDYSAIPELQKINLELYRKPVSSYLKVTLAKGNK